MGRAGLAKIALPGCALQLRIAYRSFMRIIERKVGYFGAARFAALLLAVALSGCATSDDTPDDKMGRVLVSPGKYTLYDCGQLALAAKPLGVREQELRVLIARAGTDFGGSLVATAAYKPEYYQVHGELNEIRRETAEKNCKFGPGVPAVTANGKPASRH
jgi:hypothetical protein